MHDGEPNGEDEFDMFVERGPSVIDRLAGKIADDLNTGSDPTPSTVADPEIPGYEFRRLLGRGGMGHVYLAWQTRMQRLVAIKILPAASALQPDLVRRFERELAAVGRLSHPSIVTGFDASDINGYHYLVMEYVPGQTLARLVTQHGRLPVGIACEIIRQAAVGLEKVHEAGLIHRDIKPSNLMMAEDGMTRILDLGLARLGEASDDLSVSGQVVGTIDYMAPEQAAADFSVDARADIYGLGATLFKLLCGTSPVSSLKHLPPVKKLVLIATGNLPDRQQDSQILPPDLVDILDRMLEADPDERYSSATEVADALKKHCDATALNEFAKQIRPEDSQQVSRSMAEAATISDTIDKRVTAVSASRPESSVDFHNQSGSPPMVAFTPEPAPSPQANARRWPPVRFLIVGLAMLSGFAYLLATVFFVRVEDGVIRFEINDPKIKVVIGDNAFTIDDQGKQFTMQPGDQTLRITREDFAFETRNFVLRRGENPALVIDYLDNEILLAQEGKVIEKKLVLPPEFATDFKPAPMSAVKQASWERGADSDSLLGLIPAPAQRQGLGRWQVTARSAGHTTIQSVWSPDGKWVACFADAFGAFRCGSRIGELRLYDAKTRRLARVIALGHGYQVSFSPNSQWIALSDAANAQRSVRIFGTDGAMTHHFEVRNNLLEKHEWSPDSRHLVVRGDGHSKASFCLLIDVISGQSQEVGSKEELFSDYAWHPDGKLLAMASSSSMKWFHSDGTLLPLTIDDAGHVRAIDWHPSGEWLAVAGETSGVQLRKPDGIKGTTFDHGEEVVHFVSWSPDGNLLATISTVDTLRIWNVDGTLKRQCPGQHSVSGAIWYPAPIYWHPQSLGVVACQGEIHQKQESVFWPMDDGPVQLLGLPGFPSWNANGTRLIVSSSQQWKGQHQLFRYEHGSVEPMDWEHDRLNEPFTTLIGGSGSAWSPDGSQCVVASEFLDDGNVSAGDNLCFFDADGKHLASPIRSVNVRELAVHPSGDRIAVGDSKGNVRVLSRDGQQLAAWRPKQMKATSNSAVEGQSGLAFDPAVTDLDWHPNDNVLVSCNAETVYVWDGRDGRQLAHVPASQTTEKLAAAFAPPSGIQIAVGAIDQLALWNWKQTEPLWRGIGASCERPNRMECRRQAIDDMRV